MPQIDEDVVRGNWEINWMRGILERDNDRLSLGDRLGAFVLIVYYTFDQLPDMLFRTQPSIAAQHLAAWSAFSRGDRSLLRQVVDSYGSSATQAGTIAKAEISDSGFRIRIAIYIIITLVVIVGVLKVFGAI